MSEVLGTHKHELRTLFWSLSCFQDNTFKEWWYPEVDLSLILGVLVILTISMEPQIAIMFKSTEVRMDPFPMNGMEVPVLTISLCFESHKTSNLFNFTKCPGKAALCPRLQSVYTRFHFFLVFKPGCRRRVCFWHEDWQYARMPGPRLGDVADGAWRSLKVLFRIFDPLEDTEI